MTLFYCDTCQQTSETLDEKYGYYLCVHCGEEIFDTKEELEEYLLYTDKPHIESFDKPRRFNDKNHG